MTNIQFIQKGFKLDKTTRDYIKEKLQKHEELLIKATSISVLVKFNSSYDPDKKYRMEISVSMPHTFIKVEDRASTPRELVDKLEVLLKRKLTRYYEQFKKWEKTEPWKVSEVEVDDDSYDLPDLVTYEPPIKRKKMEDNYPMHVGEALERLEMSGKNAYLFKNIENDKYAMLYKYSDEEYGLIET